MSEVDIPQTESQTVRINHTSRYVVQPILIALMVSAAGTAFLALIDSSSTSAPWLIISIPIFLMTLEGIFTAIWLSQPEQRLLNKPAYRAAEVLLFALTLRFLTWWLAGNWPEPAATIDYLRTPSLIFGDPFFIGALVISLICWTWAISIANNFQQMALDPSELSFYDLPVRERPQVERPNTPFRTLNFEQFGRQWLIGALLMACIAALSTLDTTSGIDSTNWRTIGRLSMPTSILLSLLIYFGAGFSLISQGRLAIMNARWLFANAEKTADIERNWIRQTTWLLLLTGGIAAFLPLGSTVLIGRLIELLIYAVFQILAFFGFLLALLLSLFRPGQSPSDVEFEEFVPAPFQPPPVAELPPPSEPGFPIIGTLFWIIMVAITLTAILFFLRDRGIKLPQFNWIKIKQTLSDWWQSLWKTVVEQAQDLRDAVLTRLVRDEVETDRNQPWRFIRLNSLSPQQKLRYFYLSTVQRTETGMLAKKGSDTPLEYAAALKIQLPDSAQAVDTVTQGFLQARYANHEITPADVDRVQPEWKALRKAIKGAKN